MGGSKGTEPDRKGRWKFRRIRLKWPLIRLPKIRFYWREFPGPRKYLKKLISRYGKEQVSKELHRFVNLYCAGALLQRLFIISLIVVLYVLAKELHGNAELYVAVVTLLTAAYTVCVAVAGSYLYLVFCIKNGLILNPYKAIYLYTATEIHKAIKANHWSVRLLIRLVAGKPEEFAREIAYGTIYSSDVRRLLAVRFVYYGVIAAAYMLGYRLLYEKLIGIDFNSFFHPFIWAWLYAFGGILG